MLVYDARQIRVTCAWLCRLKERGAGEGGVYVCVCVHHQTVHHTRQVRFMMCLVRLAER